MTQISNLKSQIPKDKLLINEYFSSIQGEGFHTGKPAFFIRFSGCDIGCQWCDTKDAISIKNAKLIDLSEIIEKAVHSGLPTVVITGGEPTLHDLNSLCNELKKEGKILHLETSGAYPFNSQFDWLTVSPKKINPPKYEIYKIANELKIVIKDLSDFEFASEEASKVGNNCHLFIQPEWSVKEKILPSVMNFIFKNPQWRLSLQVHKYLGIK